MQIRPLEQIDISLKTEETHINGRLISLSDDELRLNSISYLPPTKGMLDFVCKYFHGQGEIKKINFEEDKFTYYLEIYTIHFQPGFLVNCRS
jgi:hypothetical protein